MCAYSDYAATSSPRRRSALSQEIGPPRDRQFPRWAQRESSMMSMSAVAIVLEQLNRLLNFQSSELASAGQSPLETRQAPQIDVSPSIENEYIFSMFKAAIVKGSVKP